MPGGGTSPVDRRAVSAPAKAAPLDATQSGQSPKPARPTMAELQGKTPAAEGTAGRIKVFSSQALRDILLASDDKAGGLGGMTSSVSRQGALSSFRKEATTRGSLFPPISGLSGGGGGGVSAAAAGIGVGGGAGLSTSSGASGRKDRSPSKRAETAAAAERRQLHEYRAKQKELEFERDRAARLERAQAAREKQFEQMYTKLLQEKETFVQDVFHMLEMKDLAALQKRELLYRRWCEQVFDPIQRQIAQQVDSETVEELERRKRADFEAFLRASNSKPLFRDIVIPSEYDALAPRRQTVRYHTRGLVDPVKQDMLRDRKERAATGIDVSEETAARTRRTLDVGLWSKLESTPYYDRSEKPPARVSDGLKSHVAFDHYSYERDPSAVRAEFPRGKRVFPDWRPGQTVHDI